VLSPTETACAQARHARFETTAEKKRNKGHDQVIWLKLDIDIIFGNATGVQLAHRGSRHHVNFTANQGRTKRPIRLGQFAT